MISKIFRWMVILAALAVAVAVVINRGNYSSLIPSEYNPLEMFAEPEQSPLDMVEIEELTPRDTLPTPSPIDSLQQDTIKIEN